MGKKVVKECLFELKIKNTYIIFYDPLLTKSSNLLLNNTYEIFTCSYLKMCRNTVTTKRKQSVGINDILLKTSVLRVLLVL